MKQELRIISLLNVLGAVVPKDQAFSGATNNLRRGKNMNSAAKTWLAIGMVLLSSGFLQSWPLSEQSWSNDDELAFQQCQARNVDTDNAANNHPTRLRVHLGGQQLRSVRSAIELEAIQCACAVAS